MTRITPSTANQSQEGTSTKSLLNPIRVGEVSLSRALFFGAQPGAPHLYEQAVMTTQRRLGMLPSGEKAHHARAVAKTTVGGNAPPWSP
jgi:hypothetical protein